METFYDAIKLSKKTPKSLFVQPQSMTTQKLPGNQWNLPPAKTAKLMLILRIIGYPLTYNVILPKPAWPDPKYPGHPRI